MPKGTIRKLSERGYGFIKPDAGGPDIFMHASALVEDAEFDTLEEGQKVEFEKEAGAGGTDKKSRPKAINVRVVS